MVSLRLAVAEEYPGDLRLERVLLAGVLPFFVDKLGFPPVRSFICWIVFLSFFMFFYFYFLLTASITSPPVVHCRSITG